MKIYQIETTDKLLSAQRVPEILTNLACGATAVDPMSNCFGDSRDLMKNTMDLMENIYITFSTVNHTTLSIVGFSVGHYYIPVPYTLHKHVNPTDQSVRITEYPILQVIAIIKALITDDPVLGALPLVIYAESRSYTTSVLPYKIQNITASIENCQNTPAESTVSIVVEVEKFNTAVLTDVTSTVYVICPDIKAYQYGVVTFDKLRTTLKHLNDATAAVEGETYVRFTGVTLSNSDCKITALSIWGPHGQYPLSNGPESLVPWPIKPQDLINVLDRITPPEELDYPPVFMIEDEDGSDTFTLLTIKAISFNQYSMVSDIAPNEILIELVSMDDCMISAYKELIANCTTDESVDLPTE